MKLSAPDFLFISVMIAVVVLIPVMRYLLKKRERRDNLITKEKLDSMERNREREIDI